MNLTNLIIQLICGALGGNAAGSLLKKQSLGPVGNSIVRTGVARWRERTP
jgi:hypothetical protein